MDTFVYTGKTIKSIDDWNKEVQNACTAVKSLPDAKAKRWIEEDASAKGKVFYDDKISKLRGIGKMLEKKTQYI